MSCKKVTYIFFIAILADALMILWAFANFDKQAEQWLAAARYSGRASLVIFALAFLLFSYSLVKRQIEKGNKLLTFVTLFAAFHLVHFVILGYYLYLEQVELVPTRLAGGALAYLMLVLLPFIEKLKARRGFKTLRRIFLYYIWFIFFMTYLPRLQGRVENAGGTEGQFVFLISFVCLLMLIHLIFQAFALVKARQSVAHVLD